jgi:hypothetical protein
VTTIYDSLLLTVSRDWLRNDDGFADFRKGLAIGALQRFAVMLCPAKPPPGEGPVLIHGDERRGDRKLAELWESWGLPVDPHPAHWGMCGPDCPEDRSCRQRSQDGTREWCVKAGHRRNAEMVALRPRYGLALIRDKSPGASGCARLMKDAGIEVDRIPFP